MAQSRTIVAAFAPRQAWCRRPYGGDRPSRIVRVRRPRSRRRAVVRGPAPQPVGGRCCRDFRRDGIGRRTGIFRIFEPGKKRCHCQRLHVPILYLPNLYAQLHGPYHGSDVCEQPATVAGARATRDENSAVEVVLAHQENSWFASFFLPNVMIDTRAVAGLNAFKTCMIALGTTGQNLKNGGAAIRRQTSPSTNCSFTSDFNQPDKPQL